MNARSATRSLLVAVFFAAALDGCTKPIACTAEVTEGSGSHRASARAAPGEAEKQLRRRVVLLACEKLCVAKDEGAACAPRCAVDVEAGKVGARVQCGK